MRSRIFCLLMLTTLLNAQAQRNLSGSDRFSEYTYVYKITPEESKRLFKKGLDFFEENEARFLHSLIDSFKTRSSRPVLKPGNYLLVSTNEDNLNVQQYNTGDIHCKILNNYHHLQVHLHNSAGQPISNATVKVGRKKVYRDAISGVYRSSKVNKDGIIEVMLDSVLHCFSLNKGQLKAQPLQIFKRIFRKKARAGHHYRNRGYFHAKTKYETGFTGFMVFSKPVYKPGDTVKFKAWIMPSRGKPVNRPLLLRLTGEDFSVDTIIATLQPYRPGAYEYNFVLNDSLDLDLDEELLLTLEESSGRKFDLANNNGDLDEDDYALQRQVLMRNKFRYEEYELKSVTFSARTDREEHNRNTPLALFVKAVDENDMAVMDGRVEIIVTPRPHFPIQFIDTTVFLKDTLWTHEQKMDAVGETKIVLPDSIFPAASFHYNIKAIFLNSNNERDEKNLDVAYDHRQQLTELTQQSDSLRIRVIEKGKDAERLVTLLALNRNGHIFQQKELRLPNAVRIDPYAWKYLVVVDKDTTELIPDLKQIPLVCNTFRTSDSVFIQILNPCKLPGWYTVFEGNDVLQQGNIDSVYLAKRAKNRRPWFVSIQYVSGDNTQSQEYIIPYDQNGLSVELMQPAFIYPGLRTNIEVEVRDNAGKPVQDADITLYGYTSKFRDANPPQLPNTFSTFKYRKIRNRFNLLNEEKLSPHAWLNWTKWSQRLGLDTIEYYKFLYTDSIYVNYEPAVDSVKQIAPFVLSNGMVLGVQMLYIDDQPYFFRGSDQMQQYSFPLSPGIHSLRLRTWNRQVYAGRVVVVKGMKTIVSINAYKRSSTTWSEKMPDSMTKHEQEYWKRYLILVEQDHIKRPATIEGNQFMLVNPDFRDLYQHKPVNLVGPIRDQFALFRLKDRFTNHFEMEGGYLYRFAQGLVKMKQWPLERLPFNTQFSFIQQPVSLGDQVITGKMVDNLWMDFLDHRSATEDLYRYGYVSGTDVGKLRIAVTGSVEGEAVFVKNVLLFKHNDPEFVRVYKGETRELGNLREGKYRLLLLLRNDQYFLKEEIIVKRNGINFYNCGPVIPKKPDAMSRSIVKMINNLDHLIANPEVNYSSDTIKSVFNRQFFNLPSDARTVSGRVTADGQPLAGVAITLKNTQYGTVTDPDGYFSMKVPDKGRLSVTYIGYDTKELLLDGKDFYEVKLRAITMSLNEVVVVAYGSQMKKHYTGSVMTVNSESIQGRLPGLINVRGINSGKAGAKPLVVIDGIPVDIEKSKPDQSDENIPGNSLRTNFRDEAYWFPALRTNQEGKATTSVVFPDDITSWKTFAIAATDKKQFGLGTANVKSFKAISATLHLPNFAVAGDEIQVLGKTMNYGIDSILLKRRFLVDGKELASAIIGVKNNLVDSFAVTASGDSLKLAYTIQRNDGYFDGEERRIRVYPKGVTETNGMFAVMAKDTVINWQPADGSAVTVQAEASLLPVLINEMDHVFNYEYACNEQLASRLKALLMKRKVYSLLKMAFDQDKQIREIISQLNKSKATDNLWGWWKSGPSYAWISLHVIEALLLAEEQRFNIELNKPILRDYLTYSLNRTPAKIGEMLPVLRTLKRLDSKILFKPWLDSLAKKHTERNLYETLSVFAFEQETEPRAIPDSFISKRNTTVFGNVYWGEEGYRFFDNSIQNTLLMYKILKAAGNHENMLQKIRQYFLEKRRDGHWRNTYESILILETILPDLLQEPGFNTPSSLVISQGGQSHPVTSYPFTMKLNSREPVLIEKKGAQPVYLTTYQKKWNSAPEKVDSTFSVSSFFVQKKDTLKGGEPVTLQVDVKVTADASFVMVEIPIPAGCSYDGKPQPRYSYEVHREYFKEKVSIFCTELKKGKYSFTVPLLPRYNGKYNLNPANVCMMYFPVFFGREGMKQVNIR